MIAIKNIRFKNFISHNEEIVIDFRKKYKKEDARNFLNETLESMQRSKIESQMGVLKVVGLMGVNASYKTSILKSTYAVVNFIVNFKSNSKRLMLNNIDLDDAAMWYENEYGISIFEDKISVKNAIEKYSKAKINKSEDELSEDYLKYFYHKFAFDKKKPLIFEVNFFMKNRNTKVFIAIGYNNQKLVYEASLDGKKIDLISQQLDLNISLVSTELFNLDPKSKTCYKCQDDFIAQALVYLYQEVFKSSEEKMERILNILDDSIIGFKIKKFKNENNMSLKKERIVFKKIERNYGNLIEDINLEQLSSGTKTFMFYLYNILKNDFIIIDELELSLHKKLVNLLIDIARNNNKQILFSTHDPVVIKENLRMYELLIFNIKNQKINYLWANKLFRDKKDNFIYKYLNDMVSSPKDSDLDFIRMELYK